MTLAGGRRDLLSTGQAAELLGSSRQHVVDMCDRGDLSFVWVGSHRRLQRAEIERLATTRLTRDQERSLWLHRAVAGKVVLDPDATLSQAQANIARLQQVHQGDMAARYVAEWRHLIERGLDEVLETLTSRSPQAAELRQNSPFAGVLSEDERQACLAAFRSHWRRDHAA
jgi:excisionase family DNA binding protein